MKEEIEKLEKELGKEDPIVKAEQKEMTDDECSKMDELIGFDLSDSQEFIVMFASDDFDECEAIALFPDYMVIRQKHKSKNKMLCESMAMEVEHENTHDISDHIIRESISSVTIQRELSCPCDDCLAKIAKGEKGKQSDDYYIHIGSGIRPHTFMTFGDLDYTRFLQEHIMDWRLQRGAFKHKKGVFHKRIKKETTK